MNDPHALSGPARSGRTILSLVGDPAADLDEDAQTAVELADKLAAALRAARRYVPDPVWWDTGAADALIEYHARRPA